MANLFQAYLMVDWSAAAKPATGANSIWIGVMARDARLKFQFRAVNPPTRLKARAFIEEMVAKLTGRGDRVLIGFDFSLGYPEGTAAALGLDTGPGAPWAAMHAHLASKVRERDDNSNARFAIAAGLNYAISRGPAPFWGAPPRDQVSTLAGRKPDPAGGADLPLAEFRLAERRLRSTGAGQPKSVWQLYGAGSVGSQSLLGIPHVHALRAAWPGARLWPFETGLAPLDDEVLDGVDLVMAEVYPALWPVRPQTGETRDAAEVRTLCEQLRDLDARNALGAAFGPADGLEPREIDAIEREEGWILGI